MSHTQRTPDAWSSLLVVANQVAEASPGAAHRELQLAIDAFPDQEVDEARYYGLGELGSQFEARLDAATCGKVVEAASTSIFYGHRVIVMKNMAIGTIIKGSTGMNLVSAACR